METVRPPPRLKGAPPESMAAGRMRAICAGRAEPFSVVQDGCCDPDSVE